MSVAPTTEDLLRKQAITAAQTLAPGGKLLPKQSDAFIDFIIDEVVLAKSNFIRTERFRNEQMFIDKIGVGMRVAMSKAEAVDPGFRRTVFTEQIALQPAESIVVWEVSDLFKELNIEGEKINEKIVQKMSTRYANNLEEASISGNTVAPARLQNELVVGGSSTEFIADGFLGLRNGWFQRALSGNVVDATNSPISRPLLGAAIRTMPNRFRRNRGDLAFLMSSDHHQALRESISSRQTPQGDAQADGAGPFKIFGIDAMEVALLESEPLFSEDVQLNGTTQVQLQFAPITAVVVTVQVLSETSPAPAFINVTDYVVDLANGLINRTGAGAITDGQTVKVTYRTAGQVLLTMKQNLILAIGRDMRMETARNIVKGTDEFVLSTRMDFQIEELDAVVLMQNVAIPS